MNIKLTKTVTKKNLINLIELKKEYIKTENIKLKNELRNEINNYIDNVINKDKHYYRKLNSYNFSNDDLQYLM